MSQIRFTEIRRYLEIVQTLSQREFAARYRGNVFGLLPAFVVPLLFLLTYIFVFSTLIPVQIRPGAGGADYGFFLFAGFVGWNLFAEIVGKSPRLFSDQAHFVRKARFPSTALAMATCLAAFYQSLLWTGVFVVTRWALQGEVSAALLLSPLALAMLGIFGAGVSLVLASVGALLRDLADLIAPILMLGMFLSPVLYPVDRIAAVAPWLVTINPLVPQLEMLRATLLDGVLPGAQAIGIAGLWCLAALVLGVLVHGRIRPLLADLV